MTEMVRSAALARGLFLLDPEVVFLNHGSFGAAPRRVMARLQEWQQEMELQPVEFLSDQRRFPSLIARARESLAGYLKTAASNIAFYPNATSALNAVIRSLQFQPGDEVLTTNHEYGALDRAWKFIGLKNARLWSSWVDAAGADPSGDALNPPTSGPSADCQPFPFYRRAAIDLPVTSHEELVESFWRHVTERTRVVFLSHITSPTALTFPVKEICRRARESGIVSIIDGAHTVGQLELDLEDIGADFYSSNCHKWLCAPKGTAFLYARPEAQKLLEPLVVSWGFEPPVPGRPQFIEEHEWMGTRDYSGYLTVPEAIAFQRDHDWQAVRNSCFDLAVAAREQIEELTGLDSVCPASRQWFTQMFTARLPACDSEALKSRLFDEWKVEVPIVTWEEQQLIRVSIQAYNSAADIEKLLAGLRALLPLVAR